MGAGISIHAPREGSDAQGHEHCAEQLYFYPRSPRGERLDQPRLDSYTTNDFYPRSPRGERPTGQVVMCVLMLISIHAPREGSDFPAPQTGPEKDISIHAPREGSDAVSAGNQTATAIFLSTLPVRGATAGRRRVGRAPVISIHAPREGSDRPRRL